MPRVTHFEIHADDPQRAIRFYSTLLGWKFTSWPDGQEDWLIETGAYWRTGNQWWIGSPPRRNWGTAVISYVCSLDVPPLMTRLLKRMPMADRLTRPRWPYTASVGSPMSKILKAIFLESCSRTRAPNKTSKQYPVIASSPQARSNRDSNSNRNCSLVALQQRHGDYILFYLRSVIASAAARSILDSNSNRACILVCVLAMTWKLLVFLFDARYNLDS